MEKVKNIIKKEFDSEPVYNEKYLKAKIKSYKISNFDDSVFRTGKYYYLQVFLEECKYVIKEKKFLNLLLMILFIIQMMKNSDDKENLIRKFWKKFR